MILTMALPAYDQSALPIDDIRSAKLPAASDKPTEAIQMALMDIHHEIEIEKEVEVTAPDANGNVVAIASEDRTITSSVI
jgi:hypothetical protein